MLSLIADHFGIQDLRDLCFELHIDYDDLGGEGRRDKIRELLLYARRHGRTSDLLDQLRRARPDVAWPSLAEVTAAPPVSPAGGGGGDNIQVGNISGSVVAIGPGASASAGATPPPKAPDTPAPDSPTS